MKKIVLLTTFIITGCTINVGEKTEAPETTAVTTTTKATTTTTAAPTTTTQVYLSEEDQFLLSVYSETSLEYMYEDYVLIEIGKLVCESFDMGMTVDEVIAMIVQAAMNNGLTSNQISDMGFLAGSAVANFCPEHGYKLT